MGVCVCERQEDKCSLRDKSCNSPYWYFYKDTKKCFLFVARKSLVQCTLLSCTHIHLLHRLDHVIHLNLMLNVGSQSHHCTLCVNWMDLTKIIIIGIFKCSFSFLKPLLVNSLPSSVKGFLMFQTVIRHDHLQDILQMFSQVRVVLLMISRCGFSFSFNCFIIST